MDKRNRFYVAQTEHGYIATWQEIGFWCETTRPLLNFGNRKEDAEQFCRIDAPTYRMDAIRVLARKFNAGELCQRNGDGKYVLAGDELMFP